MFNVEIQAGNKTWFVADQGENLSPELADKLIAKLREQGFKARGVFVD
jgi:hypothetical protein